MDRSGGPVRLGWSGLGRTTRWSTALFLGGTVLLTGCADRPGSVAVPKITAPVAGPVQVTGPLTPSPTTTPEPARSAASAPPRTTDQSVPKATTKAPVRSTAKAAKKTPKLTCEPRADARVVGGVIVNKACPKINAAKEKAHREYAKSSGEVQAEQFDNEWNPCPKGTLNRYGHGCLTPDEEAASLD